LIPPTRKPFSSAFHWSPHAYGPDLVTVHYATQHTSVCSRRRQRQSFAAPHARSLPARCTFRREVPNCGTRPQQPHQF
jgi:hypothetical protein